MKTNIISKFILYYQKRPIGLFWVQSMTRNIAYMSTFGIIEEFRGRGIATKLFKYAQFLLKSNDRTLLFDSNVENIPAKCFYTKMGCKLLDSTDKYFIWTSI